MFSESGNFEIVDRLGGVIVAAASPNGDYSHNDDDNNVLAAITQNGTSDLLVDVKAGDIVNLDSASQNLVTAGSKYDARPMLFSFTDPVADSEETVGLRRNPRNQRFAAGIALLRKYVTATTTVEYPSAAAFYYKLQLTDEPDRVENNLKQEQDLLRGVAALIREMKYGDPIQIANDAAGLTGPWVIDVSLNPGGVTNSTTQFGLYVSSTNPGFHNGLNTSLIGATLEFTSGALLGQVSTVTDISAVVYNDPAFPTSFYYVVTVAVPFTAIPVASAQFSLTKNIEENTKFVDNYNIGNLNEVYRARIDRITNSWTSDLQERLAANKIPVVTVGDGRNTFGDFNGNTGLEQALAVLGTPNWYGGIIYVKRGSYTIEGTFLVYSNTTIMGEGTDATTITFATTSSSFLLNDSPLVVSGLAENIRFQDISIIAGTYAGGGTITGKGTVITNMSGGNAFPVKNLIIDNCYMRGGSYYNNTAGAALEEERANSILDIAIDSFDTAANEGIKILDSRFFVEGSGFYLQDCRNVQIDGCIFETETNVNTTSDFIGLVEGIVFDGGSPIIAGSAYGYSNATAVHVEGEVSISNCKFRGPHTSLSVKPYRGWVFFSPTFTGQNSSVTNCQFIGDTEGDNPAAVADPRYLTAQTKVGIGVISYTGEVVFVSGCMFHSLTEGVRCIGGKTIVTDSSFLVCLGGVVIGNTTVTAGYNFFYQLVDTNWFAPLPSVNFVTEVSGCSFSSISTNSDTGITVLPVQAGAVDPLYSVGSINITGCKFFEIHQGVDYDAIGLWTVTLPTTTTHYRSLRICNSTFDSIYGSCVSGLSVSGDYTASTPSSRSWAIQYFDYIDNIHNTVQISQTGANVIVVSGRYCTVKNNEVSGGVFDADASHIFSALAMDSLYFENNTILECYTTNTIPLPAANPLVMLGVWISSAYPSLKINNNNMEVGGSAAGRGINNGILINTSVSTDAAIKADLEFSNNNIELKNANYVFLSLQDSAAPLLTRKFMWNRADIDNNKIKNIVDDAMIGNFSTLSNDATYDTPGVTVNKPTNIQYLGNEAIYCGILDLRLFDEPDEEGDLTICNVRGNSIIVSQNASWTVAAANKNNAKLVGLRVTHWPSQINITDNVFEQAPIILHNNWWNSGNDTAHTFHATSIKVSDNTVSIPSAVSSLPCSIDITPASGCIGAAGSHLYDPILTTNVMMTGNNIKTDYGQSGVAAYVDFKNVVRFGQLEGIFRANPAAPGPYADEQINSDGLTFEWLISDNIFDGMPIILGYGMPTSANAAQATQEGVGTYVGKLTVANGTGWDWAGGTTSTLPLGPRLIVVENNMFSFSAQSAGITHNVYHMFGTNRRLGVARLYVGNISATGLPDPTTAGSFAQLFNVDMDHLPDTAGELNTAGIGADEIRSALIVQNNSATFGAAHKSLHAFTGSQIDQG